MRIIYKLPLILLAVLLLVSCSEDLTDLNQDTKSTTISPPEPLFTSAQKEMTDFLQSTSVNVNVFRLLMQQWTETTYTDETNYQWVSRNIPEQEWDILYLNVIKDLNRSIKILNEAEPPTDIAIAINKNKIAIAKMHRIFAYSILVETFGNIPYSEAGNIDIIYPKYDDAATVYKKLLGKLETAVNNLDVSRSSFGQADNIYFGDTEKWKKFGNSLMLRMGMMLTESDNATSVEYVNKALGSGVFQSIDDNANYQYLGATPNTNPLYVALVASGRKDFVIANSIIDTMNNLNDPRREKYFAENVTDSLGNVIYKGGTLGVENQYGLYTHVDETLKQPAFEGTVLTYSEVLFLKAEAAARGGYNISEGAEALYEKAITASFNEWGITDETTIDSYIDNNAPYDAGNWQESIGTQAWISLYNRGFAAWDFWRRIDEPLLTAPETAEINTLPVRMFYPIIEQTINSASYKQAASAIGGDDLTTHLFFDVN